MSTSTVPPKRTHVYVDGFNLYYGCLKGTTFKWLNIAELCRLSLPPHYLIQHIRYFTALVQPRLNDPDIHVRQQVLLRALRTIPNLEIHFGHFQVRNDWMRLVNPLSSGSAYAQVIRTDEKGSDVNLATYLLLDAFRGRFDTAVVISDDSDLAEPIRLVRKEFGLRVTVLSPRGVSRELSKAASYWTKIDRNNLKNSQFPAALTDGQGTFHKPTSW